MHRDLGIILFLTAAVLAAYSPVVRHEFVNYDDDVYVTANRPVQDGLTWPGVAWAFTTTRACNWHPLTWLSHMLDCQLFGLQAGGHHRMSVWLHIVNAALVYLVLKRLTGAAWRSAAVAALFALHPLHVQSVAWAAERKDVLSTLFWLLTMWAYVAYAARPAWWRYLLAAGGLALGLMAKPMLVTLPLVLLLLDYWPLGRLRWGENVGRRVLEKVPLLALAAASSVVTFVIQRGGGATVPMEVFPLGRRIAGAMVAYVAYGAKMFWSVDLSVFYPYPSSMPAWQVAGAAALLAGVTGAAVLAGRRRPYLAVGWLWFVGTLVPVIGLVQVGGQFIADRYTYVPLTGLFLMLVWGLADAVSGWRWGRVGLAVAAAGTLAACAVGTYVQVGYWKNSITLFERALEITPDNYVARDNLADTLAKMGRTAEAIDLYCQELILRPRDPMAPNNLAWILATHEDPKVRNGPTAVFMAERACAMTGRRDSNYLDTLAAAYAAVGRFSEAVATAREAAELAETQGRKQFLAEIEGRLRLYEQGQPYREPHPPPPSDAP